MADDGGSYERELRRSAMGWLDSRQTSKVDYAWLSTFEFEGRRVPLMDRQRGIRKPAGLEAALSIRTTFTPSGKTAPYDDVVGADGFARYKYRGSDPDHPENVALRRAMQLRLPLIWFVAVAPGQYEPIAPAWVVGDDRDLLEFTLAVDEAQRFLPIGAGGDEDTRRYAERITKARLHQRVFRTQVLLAYEGRCTICQIRHAELLDAAHIIEDGRPLGQPVVPNGLSLCKIHHAAFDNKILGIRPDLTIHVRQDVLDEVDGWMLKGGIQGVHNTRLGFLPKRRGSYPDSARLEERYSAFLSA